MRPVSTLCAGVDVKGLEDVVEAARPYMDGVLGLTTINLRLFRKEGEIQERHLEGTVQDGHGMGVGAAR